MWCRISSNSGAFLISSFVRLTKIVSVPGSMSRITPAGAQLIPTRARDLPSDRAVGRIHESRAVEAGPARRAAPAVGDAHLVASVGHDPVSELLQTGGVTGLRTPVGRVDSRESGLGP